MSLQKELQINDEDNDYNVDEILKESAKEKFTHKYPEVEYIPEDFIGVED